MKVSFCGCNEELKNEIYQNLDLSDFDQVGVDENEIVKNVGDSVEYYLLFLNYCLMGIFGDKTISEKSLIDVFAWSNYLAYSGKLNVTVRDAAANALEAGLKYYDAVFYLPPDKNANQQERAVDRIIKDYIAEVKVSNRKQNIIKLSGDLQSDLKTIQGYIKRK